MATFFKTRGQAQERAAGAVKVRAVADEKNVQVCVLDAAVVNELACYSIGGKDNYR